MRTRGPVGSRSTSATTFSHSSCVYGVARAAGSSRPRVRPAIRPPKRHRDRAGLLAVCDDTGATTLGRSIPSLAYRFTKREAPFTRRESFDPNCGRASMLTIPILVSDRLYRIARPSCAPNSPTLDYSPSLRQFLNRRGGRGGDDSRASVRRFRSRSRRRVRVFGSRFDGVRCRPTPGIECRSCQSTAARPPTS